jgi:hypothetical protein
MMRQASVVVPVLAFALASSQACIAPTNPFDPDTPAALQAPAAIFGKVRSVDGGALRGTAVSLFEDGSLSVTVETGDDGAFAFSALTPGGWTLDVAHPAHLPASRAFLLQPGEARNVDIVLAPLSGDRDGTGHVTGVVQREAELARPVEAQDHGGITVEVVGSGIRTASNGEGRFDLFLLPGSYELAFSTGGHAPTTRSEVEVVANVTNEVEPVVLPAMPGSLAGLASLEGGASPADVLVNVVGTGLTALTAADGSFLIGAVPAGNHTLSFAKDGYATASVGSVPVEAAVTTNVATVRLLRARDAIEGTIDLVGRADDSGVAVGVTGTAFTAVTNEVGRFRIDGVPEGIYEVTASRDGFLRGLASSVTVRADEVAQLSIQLAQRVGDFEINGGALFTRERTVRLSLDTSDAAFFMASEDASFSNASLGDTIFRPVVSAAVDFELSAGDGDKSVFVQFRDAEGITSGPFSSSIALDTTPPAPPLGEPAVLINGGAAFTNNAGGIVTLGLSAVDATSGVASMQLSTDAILDEPFQPFATSTVFTLAAGADGPRQVFVRFQDRAGNVSQTFQVAIGLDRVAPVVTSFTINGGAGFTASSLVELSIVASDGSSGLSRMALSTSAAFGVDATEPFAATRSFFLSPGEGTRAAFLKVFDAAGNQTDVISDDIVVDSTPPSGTAVVINGNAAQTNSTSVTLNLTATGATRMRVCLDGVLDNEPIESFAATKSVTLPGGDGNKTVFAVFLDDAGNTSSIVSDSIVLDTQAPVTPPGEVALRINGGAAFTNNATGVVTLSLAATDATTSVASMQLSTDGTLDSEAFVPFQSTLVFTLGNPGADGSKQVLVRFRDAAGNTGAAASATITLDRAPPTVTAFTINNNAAFTTSSVVDLQIAANDSLSGVAQMALSTSAGFPSEVFEPFGSPRTFVLAPGDGSRSAFVKVRDAAGNVSTVASDAITVDATPPQGVSVLINGGAAVTNNPQVQLSLAAQGATTMRVSLDGVFDTEPTESFATTKSVTLSGQGTKSVFVLFADDAGNASAVATASIEVDTVPPASPSIAFVTTTPGFVASTSATVGIGGTGATQMKIRIVEDANCGADPAVSLSNFSAIAPEPFVSARTLILPPNAAATNGGAAPANRCKHAQLLLLDNAGNTSSIVQARVELDTLAPDAPRIVTQSTVVNAASTTVELGVNARDHNFATYQVKNGNAAFTTIAPTNGACVNQTSPACTFSITLLANSENRISLRAIDAAGNVSAEDFVSIRADSAAPAAPATLAATPADGEVTLSWPASTAADVAGYEVLYAHKLTAGACPTAFSAYTSSSFASEGPSPIDVGQNRSFRLTGLSNNLELCLAVRAYDQVVTPGPNFSGLVTATMAPNELGLVRVGRITSAQLGLGTGLPRAIVVRDGTAWVAASGTGNGLVALDITDESCFALTDPAAFAACTNLKKSGTTLTDPRDLKLHGHFAYIADGSAGTRVFRVEEGRVPVQLPFSPIPLQGGNAAKIALSVAVSDHVLAVGRSSSSVRAFDGQVDSYIIDNIYSATPAAPGFLTTVTQTLATFGDPGAGIFGFDSVDLQGFILAAGSHLFSISVFGASPSTLPAEGNSVAKLGGRFMYSVSNDNGLDNDFKVIDFTQTVDVDPGAGVDNRHPVVSRAIGTAAHRIELMGPYVLVAGRGFLDIYDVSDRRTSRYVTTYRANNVAGGVAFNADALRGSVAAEGNRIFFTSATVGEIDVLRLGDPAQLQAVSSIEDPPGGLDAVVFGGNAYLQANSNSGIFGSSPEALVHFGQRFPVIDFQTRATSNAANVAAEGDIGLFFAGATLERAFRNKAGLSGHAVLSMPAGVLARSGVFRWPWAIIATTSSAGASIQLRSVDYRPLFSAPTIASTQNVATSAVAGRTFQLGPESVAVHGGFVYVGLTDAVFGGSSNQAVLGLYRATFNPHTGAIGAPVKLESGAVTSVHPYGRRVFFARNNGGFVNGGQGLGDIRAQTLADPDTWTSANVVTVAPVYPYEHRIAMSGPFMFLARDLDGVSVHRLGYDPVTFRPTPATTVLSFDPGADSATAQVIGDRVYFHQSNTGGLIFRTR